MNCGTCSHWQLRDSPLRSEGFAGCAVNPSEFAKAQTFSVHARCRMDKYQPAGPEVMERRAGVLPKLIGPKDQAEAKWPGMKAYAG